MRSCRSFRSSNAKVLLALLLFVLAQGLELFHLSEHDAQGGNETCDICITAAHSGQSVLPEVSFPLPAATGFEQEPAFVFRHSYTTSLLVYASRAPPAHS